jgi:hypothetical protein
MVPISGINSQLITGERATRRRPTGRREQSLLAGELERSDISVPFSRSISSYVS